jgi:hypothetical protein
MHSNFLIAIAVIAGIIILNRKDIMGNGKFGPIKEQPKPQDQNIKPVSKINIPDINADIKINKKSNLVPDAVVTSVVVGAGVAGVGYKYLSNKAKRERLARFEEEPEGNRI